MASSLTYVAILVIGTLLIVAGSMSVHEAVKDPADDKDVNHGLRAVAWITLLISLGGLVFYAPYYAHSRTNLLLAYVMQACAIFGLLISLIAIECSNNHPNSVTLVKPLKGMGGGGYLRRYSWAYSFSYCTCYPKQVKSQRCDDKNK
jgi:hypothetical protein